MELDSPIAAPNDAHGWAYRGVLAARDAAQWKGSQVAGEASLGDRKALRATLNDGVETPPFHPGEPPAARTATYIPSTIRMSRFAALLNAFNAAL